MATPTYTPLATVTASGGSGTQLVMSSIPQTYTDLVLVCSINYDSTSSNVLLRYNGDSGSNYSTTILSGNGSSPTSQRYSNSSSGWLTDYYGGTANEPFTKIIHIQNYSNTTTYKTAISRSSSASREAEASVGLWRSTAAINSITAITGANFNAGSTFTLYGIANAAIGAPKATGGIITYDNTYYYHTFGASGTFTPQQSLTADILVVAGGGSGGRRHGGGGGAGGLCYQTGRSLTATGYTVTIGAGGAAATAGGNGTTGNNSVFDTITSLGGGAGIQTGTKSAANGGSGGGSADYGTSATVGGTATQGSSGGATGYGNNGGAGKDNGSNSLVTGGGGGSGTVGQTAPTTTQPGNGGSGLNTWSSWASATGTGVSGYYAGGGGGASFNQGNGGVGGSGGGGAGGTAPTSGIVNTGSGGGGEGPDNVNSGAGGSGIVIVRYAK